MNEMILDTAKLEVSQATAARPDNNLGVLFLKALAAQDFEGLAKLFKPDIRFRATVPSGERPGKTAEEATMWFRRWFGKYDSLTISQSSARPVFTRLYLSYQLRLHDPEEGWKVIEQHAYCDVKDAQIADMWLICSGFFPERDYSIDWGAARLPAPQSCLGGDLFYDAGSKGCAEGAMDEIARLLRTQESGQTLEIHAIDPSVTADLSAWCRLSGHALVRHAGDYFLIQHK